MARKKEENKRTICHKSIKVNNLRLWEFFFLPKYFLPSLVPGRFSYWHGDIAARNVLLTSVHACKLTNLCTMVVGCGEMKENTRTRGAKIKKEWVTRD